MKEIGGYLELETLSGRGEYYPDLIALNSGRNALAYLIQAKHIRKLYIPGFLCDTVPLLCEREHIPYERYDVDAQFRPVFDKELEIGAYFYLVNYYGQLSDEEVLLWKQKYDRLIVDHVQAFFQNPLKGVDTIYSCRKFFGVPDGAYLATDAALKTELPADVSAERMAHILGRFDTARAGDYYAASRDNNRQFRELELRQMSRLTHNILGAVDYQYVMDARNRNYAVLESALGARNGLKLKKPAAPFAYPFYYKNGLQVKKELAQRGIFVPTLWPNVLEQGNELERDFAANILPLPCDQRYGRDDMQIMLQKLDSIIEIS